MSNYIEALFQHIVQRNRVKECEEPDQCEVPDDVILNLCGGIPDNSLANITLNITITSPCVYDVEVISDLYYLSRLIDFNSRTINNFLMRVSIPNSGIGTNLFLNQIIAARSNAFTELITSAAEGKGFNGYYHWGKLGYTMTALDRNKFSNWCAVNHLENRPLCEILDSEEGRTKWLGSGFGWSGIFQLEGDNCNIQLLRKYLSERSHFADLVNLL